MLSVRLSLLEEYLPGAEQPERTDRVRKRKDDETGGGAERRAEW